jgi:hypothetical protein
MSAVTVAEAPAGVIQPAPPPPPATIAETGLHPDTLSQLLLKTLIGGESSGTTLADRLRLPYSVLESLVQHARVEKLIEVRGTTGVGTAGYRYILTDLGRERALQFLDVCRYVGPAPVPLSQYTTYVRQCMAARPYIDRELLTSGFNQLIVNKAMLDQLGPAVNAGKSLFIYGKPGKGNTCPTRWTWTARSSRCSTPSPTSPSPAKPRPSASSRRLRRIGAGRRSSAPSSWSVES